MLTLLPSFHMKTPTEAWFIKKLTPLSYTKYVAARLCFVLLDIVNILG